MLKVLTIFGTRPETIKIAPVVEQMKRYPERLRVRVCVTAQHRHMLDPLLRFFAIEPDHDLDIMTEDQDLFGLTASLMPKLKEVIGEEAPDIVVVQGDTTSTFCACLAAYYHRLPVAHIEAGLRTRDKYAPFPEEVNRRLTDAIADFLFAPTEEAKRALLREGYPEERITVTGNTVIDALLMTAGRLDMSEAPDALRGLPFPPGEKLILLTAHRREIFGEGIRNICRAAREITEKYEDVRIVYPVHMNPNISSPVYGTLSGIERVHLIPPLKYVDFVWLMNRAYLILTDSGGVQEEAPTLDKPVLVIREKTERGEGVTAGALRLVGTEPGNIVREVGVLLRDAETYARMASASNPYGDGLASERIVEKLLGE